MKMPFDLGYPKIITFITGRGFQVVFVLITFCLIVFYNAAYYIYVPVTGVWLDYDDETSNSAIIFTLDPGSPGEKAGLQVEDRIITIDGRLIENLNIPIHQPKRPGEIETYVIRRDQHTLTIPLRVGSYSDYPNYLTDMIPVQLLSLLIYFLGLTLLFFSPATDFRARLVAILWVLAGVAIAATGPGYNSCAWFAPDVSLLTFAALIFVSISAHLYFPVTTFSHHTRKLIIWALFGLSVGLSCVYFVQQLYLSLHHQYPRISTTIAAQAINYPFYLCCLVNISLLFWTFDKVSKKGGTARQLEV